MYQRILVVDDSHLNRQLLLDALIEQFQDCVLYEAEDGVIAMDIIREKDIDVILLDLVMPNKDGFGVLNDLKSDDDYKDIPVIVNSTLDDIDTIKKALEFGAYDYFTKPFTKEQLEVVLPIKLKNALKTYSLIKELTRVNGKITSEVEIAKSFQTALIENYKNLETVEMFGKYSYGPELKGDVYDCIKSGNSVWFIMADVKNYGVTAAIVTLMIKVIFNSIVDSNKTPAEIMNHINKVFCNMSSASNALVFNASIGVLKHSMFSYAGAGNCFPIVFDTLHNKIMVLRQSEPLAGLFDDTKYNNESCLISKNCYVMMCNNYACNNSCFADEKFYNRHTEKIMEKLKEDPHGFIDWIVLLAHEDMQYSYSESGDACLNASANGECDMDCSIENQNIAIMLVKTN